MLTESHLFYIPPTITERQATHDVLVGPSAATFDDANDITFDIAPCNDLISLADIRFVCDLVVQNSDGTKLTPENCVCPSNNILSSLFQNVQVTLAGRSISDPSNLYFMRAYLENLLGHTPGAMKSGQLFCESFYLDETQDPNVKNEWIAAAGNVVAYAKYKNQDQLARSERVKSGDALFF